MLLQLPCRSLSSSPARSHLWFKPSLLLHWHSRLLVEKNIYTPVSLQNSPSSSHCKFKIANLKRALGAVQKSSLSPRPGMFIFPLCKMTLSHFFLLPERSTSPSFPLHSQMPFNTSRRKSELIARNSIIASAHLLFCSIRTHVLCLFACRSVRSVSAAVRGHCSPLVLWISFLSATWSILFLHPSWKISPFPHVCSSSLLGRIVRTPAHPKILHLKQNFPTLLPSPISVFLQGEISGKSLL